MRQSHLILINALIIWASRVLLLFPQIVLVPYLIGTIGETGYGVYALVWSLLMGIDQLEQSLQQGVVKYSAAYLAEGRIDEMNRVVSSSFVFSLLLAVAASIGISAIALTWQADGPDVASALLAVAGLMLLIIPLTPYLAVIQSRQRYYVGAIAETFSKYMSLAVIFAWFTWVSPSVRALILITAATLFVSRFAQVFVAYRLVPGLRNNPALCSRAILHLLLTFGAATVVIALCAVVNNAGLRWLMGLLVSPSFVTHLAIMVMPGLLLTQIVQAMTVTIMPVTSALAAVGDENTLRELLLRSMRYTAILVLAALLTASLLLNDVLVLWVGPEYSFLTPYTLAIFAGICMLMTNSSAHHMLKGLGQLRISAMISLIAHISIPFPLILLVFWYFENPYIAVASGLIAGHTVYIFLYTIFAAKAVHAGLRDILVRVYCQPLLAAATVGAPTILFVAYADIEGMVSHLALTALAIGAFLTQMYFLFATSDERKQAHEIVAVVFQRGIKWVRRQSKSAPLSL